MVYIFIFQVVITILVLVMLLKGSRGKGGQQGESLMGFERIPRNRKIFFITGFLSGWLLVLLSNIIWFGNLFGEETTKNVTILLIIAIALLGIFTLLLFIQFMGKKHD